MKICVIGRTSWLLDAARNAAASGHQISAVITAKGAADYKAQVEDFERFANENGARFFRSVSSVRPDIISFLSESATDMAITMNFPGIIESEFIEIFPMGVFNCHGSLLPKNRGNACPNWSILNGDDSTGLTIHKIVDHGLDTGPIAYQAKFPINETTYITDVYNWYDNSIPDAFATVMATADAGHLQLVEQDERAATVCYPRRPSDGLIDFRLSNRDILRLVRATSRPFEGAYALLEGEVTVRFFAAEALDLACETHAVCGQVLDFRAGDFISVKTADGAIRSFDFLVERGDEPIGRRSRFG